MNHPLRAALLALCALLAACTTTPPAPGPPPVAAPADEAELWSAHRELVAALSDWDARGKVAFRLPDEAGSANLRWQHDSDGNRVRLAGPLGANAVTLRDDGGLIVLSRDGIERRYPADAAPWLGDGRLLPIPVRAIEHWLRGIPDPERDVETLETTNGLATLLRQADWEVRYEDYEERDGVPLPSALSVHAASVDLRLRVLIRDWQLAPTDDQPRAHR